MDNDNNTLQNWMNDLEKDIKASNLLSFDIDNKTSIRIMKDDFISLFNDTLNGKVSKICKLDNFLSIQQAIATYTKENEVKGNEIFTNLNQAEQQAVFSLIKEKSDEAINNSSYTNAYLCFGLLRYNLDVFATASKQAPLVFVPITLSYDKDSDAYFMKGVPGEVYLNTVLLDRIKKVRRIDLSYPIDSNFSISDFLYYISIKIQTLNWSLSNYVFVSNFELSPYSDFLEIRNKKEEISEHEIVKKISYFNAQFYQFSERNKKALDTKYLSILDLDNDEYSILKRISARENLFIRANDFDSKIHLISNTILAYNLNNLKTLVVYTNQEEKNELLKYIDGQGYSNYVCDLNPLSTNKNDLLADIVNYDNYLLPYTKSKATTLISDDLQAYYNYKNNYKKLTNLLRSVENPMHISLNKLVNEYYKLDKFPLINITINEPNRLSTDDLSRYMDFINAFADTIINLQCPIDKHPFYGFNRKIMRKNDYEEFKEAATKLSVIINDTKALLNVGQKKYGYPLPTNLKEFKALLNILAFVDEYKMNPEWINDIELKAKYSILCEIRFKIEVLNKQKQNYINKYTRKIQFISEDLVNEYLKTKSPKTKTKIRRLLGKQVPMNEIDEIIDELHTYYTSINDVKEETSHYDAQMVEMMRNNSLDEFNDYIKQIYAFRASLKYIKNKNDFDVLKYLGNKNENRLIHRKAMQNAYNKLLALTTTLQTYFDNKIYLFKEYSFDLYEAKATDIAKNFIKINDFTAFYKSLLDTNDFIPSLGDELINAGKPEDFKKIFLKKFYYDIIHDRINANKLLKENTRDQLYKQLTNFSSSDEKRKEMITKVISNNIDNYLKRNLLRLKHDESEGVYSLFSKKPKFISMNMITSLAKESLYNIKPCILVSYKEVSKYLNNDLFKYDAIIFLPNKEVTMIEALPSLTHSQTCIVFDKEYLSKDPRKSIKFESNVIDNTFLENAKHSYHISSYTSDTRSLIIHNSPLDAYVKQHIATKLVEHGFDVRVDYSIKTYIIDILVRVPNTKNVIAIELNHLPYNSPEDTYKSFLLEDNIIQDLGFIPYRVFTVSYFSNEENENNEMIDFIIKKSNVLDKEDSKKKQVLLMDYLFTPYISPHLIYYKINKKDSSLEKNVMEVIKQCAPISAHELNEVIPMNIKPIVKRLAKEKQIEIDDDSFIYLPNAPIIFKRVNREENYIRPIKYVSKKEIYDAIYRVVNHLGSIDKEVLVKMILLSLGYKKMSKESYEFIIKCMEFLVNEKIIFINENMLYNDVTNL